MSDHVVSQGSQISVMAPMLSSGQASLDPGERWNASMSLNLMPSFVPEVFNRSVRSSAANNSVLNFD